MADGDTPDFEALQAENQRLKADLDAARSAQNEEARRADTLSGQVSQGNQRVSQAYVAQLTALETAADGIIASTATEIVSLKNQIASLNSEGKFAEAADLQEKLGDATARRREAQGQKTYYANQKTQAAAQPTDPIEQFLAANQGTYTARDVNWIRTNRRYVEDQNFRNRVIQAHGDAVTRKIPQGSDEYYRFLEDRGYMRAEAPSTSTEGGGGSGGGGGDHQRPTSNGGSASTGYSGGDPTSDTGANGAGEVIGGGDGPQIVITRGGAQQMPQEDDTRPAFNREPANPQPRAAGPGSMRAAMASAPSRRPVGSPGRRTVLELTEEQADTAMALAPHMAPPDVLAGGKAAVLQWYHDNYHGATAQRLREQWANR